MHGSWTENSGYRGKVGKVTFASRLIDMESSSECRKPVYRDVNLQIIFCVTLMAVLGITVFVPAFPKIINELNISTQDVGLLISVYTVPGIFLTLILGALADRFGRKKILTPSLFLFGIAGVACAFARDFNLLLALRFLQGVGAAPLMALNITIIGDLYLGHECTTVMGYNVSFVNVGLAIFPLIGGAMAMIGWYYPFLLSVVAIPVGILVLFSLKNPEPKNEQRLKEYLSGAWGSVKGRLSVGVFMASAFGFAIYFGSYLTFFPVFIGESFGASSLTIGLIMSAVAITSAITSSQIGRLAKFYSEKNLIKVAFLIYATPLAIIPFVSDLWVLIILVVILGVAHGIDESSIHALLPTLAPMRHRAVLISVNETFLLFGVALGPVLMGAIFGTWGIAATFFAGAILSIVMFVLAVIFMR